MRERVLAGDPCTADDPELGAASTRALDVADAYNATTVRQGPLRRRLPEVLLGSVGEGAKWEAAEPITIGDDVWLGGGVVVLPGVTIGENAVVGAGAVVTRDLPADVVAAGNPARVVRTLDGPEG
ncbi:Maltose acetyltransferase [Geodermatophilus poikilotrophus]|uniref:Maltose acetyltransferase n=2 Tax=Geodermatophilus poikilotrophus TaxID=1333667 RepID=A0A1I0EQB3_9ACTN|nr:Maltose acetyltransferase [Geodermatophilus poikilotrophus]